MSSWTVTCCVSVVLSLTAPGDADQGQRDESERAAACFRDANEICRNDGGRLWGVSLCGPILLVDPATRDAFANQADGENQLQKSGDVFRGKLPPTVNIANTAIEWAGTRWTMVMLPLPADQHRRNALLAHEMWHRIQDQLGFPSSGAANNHLDTRDGRIWLQLEWRALAAALRSTGDQEREVIVDAALFRARRHQIFPNAAQEERSMELNEGLAEYTGVRLSGSTDLRQFVVAGDLKDAAGKESFVRSFAYATGPAYGLLLDEADPQWRKSIRGGDDLAEILLRLARLKIPDDVESAANARAEKYSAAQLIAAEKQREQDRQKLLALYRARFVDGPVLTIPLRKMNMQFNPGNLIPLETRGTVYPQIRVIDQWGVLDVSSNGALMSADFTRVTVPAPADFAEGRELKGDGWTLELNPGWSVKRVQNGNFAAEEQRAPASPPGSR